MWFIDCSCINLPTWLLPHVTSKHARYIVYRKHWSTTSREFVEIMPTSLHTGLRLQYILFHSQNQISNYKQTTKSTASINYYHATAHNTAIIQSPWQVPQTSQEFPSRLLNNITILLNHNWKSTWSLTKLYEYWVVGVGKKVSRNLWSSWPFCPYLCAKSKINHSWKWLLRHLHKHLYISRRVW